MTKEATQKCSLLNNYLKRKFCVCFEVHIPVPVHEYYGFTKKFELRFQS